MVECVEAYTNAQPIAGKKYPCAIQPAMYQKITKPGRKTDQCQGTIDADPKYKAFLGTFDAAESKQ